MHIFYKNYICIVISYKVKFLKMQLKIISFVNKLLFFNTYLSTKCQKISKMCPLLKIFFVVFVLLYCSGVRHLKRTKGKGQRTK